MYANALSKYLTHNYSELSKFCLVCALLSFETSKIPIHNCIIG